MDTNLLKQQIETAVSHMGKITIRLELHYNITKTKLIRGQLVTDTPLTYNQSLELRDIISVHSPILCRRYKTTITFYK